MTGNEGMSTKCYGIVTFELTKACLRKLKIFLRSLRFEFKNEGVDLSHHYNDTAQQKTLPII
jgi:hypothetical protein